MFKVVSYFSGKAPLVEIVTSVVDASRLATKRLSEGANVSEYCKAE